VCDLVENYANERAEELAKKTAKSLFENGVSYEVVRGAVTVLSDKQLEEIYQKVYDNSNE